MKLPLNTQKTGFTLIEILVAITIIALVVTIGISAYQRSRDRQTVAAAKESILSALNTALKSASVGNKFCTGALTGIEVSLGVDSITTQAHCSLDSDPPTTTAFSDLTFINIPPNFTIRPLSGGIIFGSGTSANIDYMVGSRTFRISISNPGSVTYLGEI